MPPSWRASVPLMWLACVAFDGCAGTSSAEDHRRGDASTPQSAAGGAGPSPSNATPGDGPAAPGADDDVPGDDEARPEPVPEVDAGGSSAGPGFPPEEPVDAGADPEPSVDGGRTRDAGAPTDAGVDAGIQSTSDAGEAPCTAGAVRCHPQSGQREACEAGAWVEQGFVCATSVRVNANEGIPCAAKADGEFLCWWGRGQYRALDHAMPPFSGTVHSLEYVVYDPSSSTSAAVLTTEGTLADPLGNQVPGVVQFEPSRHDVCWVTEAGAAACSEFGPITDAPATEVAIDMTRRCALLRDGSVVCHLDGAEPVTLPGPYGAIDMGSYTLCGLELDGRVACMDLQDATPTPTHPLEGTHVQLAVNDVGVCAMRESGELDCVAQTGSARQPTGTYAALDAGDWTVCAIRTDGAIECWQLLDGSDEPWFMPEGW